MKNTWKEVVYIFITNILYIQKNVKKNNGGIWN